MMEPIKEAIHNNPTVTSCVAGVGSLVVLYLTWKRMTYKPPVPAPPGTVILRQIPRGIRAPSLSPFPLKLETFLRLAKVPYVNDISTKMSSKGKTPWITLDGEDVADSQLCIRFLNNKLNLDLNRTLTSEQKAVSRAIQVMVDEHLYWTLVHCRWVYDKKHTIFREHFRFRFNNLLLWMITKQVKKQLHGQGMGRHSIEDVQYFMMDDLTALQNYLGDKAFMVGDVMTEVDCSVFGMLCQFVFHAEDDVMKDLVRDKFPKLLTYVERIKALIWPDWEDCLRESPKNKKLS